MAYTPDFRAYAPATGANAAVIDAGLRAYMLRVYNWMASGLLLTGVVAYGVANTSLINLFYPLVQTPYGLRHTQGPLAIVAMLAPLAFVLVLWRQPPVKDGRSGDLLGVLRRDGRQPDVDLPRL